MCVCSNHLFAMFQRQQYHELPEAEIRTKAQNWKVFDEKERERRQALYQDILTHQQTVSHFYMGAHVLYVPTAILTFPLHPPQLTLSITDILKRRRMQEIQAAATTVTQPGHTWTRKSCFNRKDNYAFALHHCSTSELNYCLTQNLSALSTHIIKTA